ncbi:MAG: YeeE/YedE family protein [Methylibium sp.]|nr:YeeE/YedE family protein [Methylibium sp.]
MELELNPETATRAVVWGALLIGVLLGAAGQASRFCIRGAIADWFVFRGQARLMTWVLAVAVASLGSQVLIGLQVFDAERTLPWSERFVWASYLVGGALFGYGMVLAAGCPQRSLVKAGSGNLKSLVTLLVAAVVAQMTLRGVLAEVRVQGLDTWSLQLGRPQDLGSLLAVLLPASAATLRWALLLGVLGIAGTWLWRARASMKPVHWIGGAVVGALVPVSWWLTGQVGFIAEHPETLEAAWLGTQSRRPEALSFTAPLAHVLDLLTFWTDQNTKASFGVLLTLGVVLGSFVTARLRGEFRVESFKTTDELRGHLAGGALMGFGGVTALGCSLGQGLTGLAMLSAGACLAVAGIVAGAFAALNVQAMRVGRRSGASLATTC